ncbi:OmpH family outer membrane protein [bacterium]|nr:OmpH family outer membrane protein [bacterium]
MQDNKKLIYIFGAVGLVLLAASVYLLIQVNTLEKRSAKIGYVKSDVLLANYKPAIAIQQKLQEETSHVQKELEERYKELQGMDADLKKKSQVLTMQALAPQMERFQTKQSEFLQMQQGLQQAVSQKQAQLLEPVFQDISNFINKYGKDNGYTLIFGTPVEGMVIYGDPAQDLTEILSSELNSRVPPAVPVPLNPAGGDSTKK